MCMGRLQTGGRWQSSLTLVVGSVAQRCWSHWGYYTPVDHGLHAICCTSNIFNGKVPLFYKITCLFLESSQAIIKNNLVCGQGRLLKCLLVWQMNYFVWDKSQIWMWQKLLHYLSRESGSWTPLLQKVPPETPEMWVMVLGSREHIMKALISSLKNEFRELSSAKSHAV